MNQTTKWLFTPKSKRMLLLHFANRLQWVDDQMRQDRYDLAYTAKQELSLLISSQPIKSSLITGTIIHEAIEQSIKYGFVLINTEPPESNLITREELLINPPKQPDDCTFKPHHKKKTKQYF